MTTDNNVAQKAIALAINVIVGDRDALLAAHQNPRTGAVDVDARYALKRYDEALAGLSELAASQEPTTARCPRCDDSGDVHTPTGEWRGRCTCEAGKAQPIAAQPLTDDQIDAAIEAWFSTDITTNNGKDRGHPFRQRMRVALERAHGIGTQGTGE